MASSKSDSCQHFLGPYHQEEILLVQTYQDFLLGKDSVSPISYKVSEQGALRVRGATCLPRWLVLHMACRLRVRYSWMVLVPSLGFAHPLVWIM